MADPVSTERLMQAYIKIRRAKADHTREYEAKQSEYKGSMKQIEVELLRRADEQNVTGFQVKDMATAYEKEEMHVSIGDDNAFYNHVRETGDLEFFERRITVKHVKEYMDQHDGELPPGIHVFREKRMEVRAVTPKKKGKRDERETRND